ncbi:MULTISPECIES: hypothetical protein [Streptomyces]|uniref:DUF4333 domain-containing protein n=1 Tax=Streptomyces rhizosphaericola TaxID=2564098 RepID=A0ABY2PI58_9ACTN|nr:MULTISPECIES: hypothetical protein [Streptomyces]ARI51093.1 hypothetical protein A6E92_02260 [Streptomyces sp. S8]MYU01130.1 hypothetical protein [Streptomyces sp. SID8350]NGO83827.1 hypothetical protein [Streptomyces sp. 196(2019)]TGZ10608.1 hypothetical protein E5Z02_09025 [Streptomyces rhizosphaericola]SCK60025.1 hypothetical protein YUWDRAFT_05706 [Streptomyces sp. AmelKG-D3]
MHYTKKLIGLAAVGILAVGCGSGNSSGTTGTPAADSKPEATQETSAAPEAAPLAVAVDGPQKDVLDSSSDGQLKVLPKPDNSAPFTERVEHKLQEQVLGRVKVPGKTSAECPDGVTQKAGAVSTCNVTYEGAVIPYEVKISDSYKEGSFMTFYNAKPLKGLIVAKVVYNQLFQQYGSRSDATKLACEEFPAAQAVDFEADSGLTCQYWSKYGNQGDGGYETLRVKAGTYGPSFEQVR